MKNILKNIFIILLFFFTLGCASQNRNYVTYNEYAGIKINGKSLLEINTTKGDRIKMNTLFGKNFTYKSLTVPDLYNNFIDKDLDIQFLKASNEPTINYELDLLRVLSSSVIVEIKGITFKIGDPVSILQSKFLKHSTSGNFIFEINQNSNTFFGRSENFFLVEIKNNLISDITLLVLD